MRPRSLSRWEKSGRGETEEETVLHGGICEGGDSAGATADLNDTKLETADTARKPTAYRNSSTQRKRERKQKADRQDALSASACRFAPALAQFAHAVHTLRQGKTMLLSDFLRRQPGRVDAEDLTCFAVPQWSRPCVTKELDTLKRPT
jgi:hypothetical protein